MTIADNVIDVQNKLQTIIDHPQAATVDFTPVLDVLKEISAKLEPTPTPAPTAAPAA